MKDVTIYKIWALRFFTNLLFWYGIEQLFMDKVIGDPNTRAVAVTCLTVGMVLLNIPTGYFADKVGRKRALVTASILQFCMVCVQIVSTNAATYGLSMVVMALYFTMHINALNAYLYDYLKLRKRQQSYAAVIGSSVAFMFAGAAIANLLSGFIADHTSLQFAYIISLIPILIAIGIGMSLPNIATQTESEELTLRRRQQVIQHFTRPAIVLYGTRKMLFTCVYLTLCEFGQSYLLSFGVTATQLGILWAVDAVACSAIMLLSRHASRRHDLTAILFAVVLTAFGLLHGVPSLVLFFVMYAMNELMSVVTETEIQHAADSRVRSTVTAIISAGGYGIGIAAVWLYNQLMHTVGMPQSHYSTALIAATLLCVSLGSVYYAKKTGRLSR